MCGILGVYNNSNFNINLFEKSLDTLKTRGPDDRGIWIEKNEKLFLGHTRLSIIDLSLKGKQPMISNSGRYILVYNGEIYNFQELKEKIEKKKQFVFKSKSDTEVLLESIDCFGFNETLKLIDGMFAFSIFDKTKDELILVRDRYGEKPLYFGQINSDFFFSSDLKFLKLSKEFDLKINPNSVNLLLNYSYIPAPHTIYNKIFKLEPYSYLKVKISDLKKKNFPKPNESISYNDLNNTETNIVAKNSISENSKILGSLINQSVKKRLVSDVPIGCFLSGGIDSSLVASYMQKNSTNKIETFSIGQSDKKYDELSYARKISKILGTNHNEYLISDSEILDTIENINHVYSEPFADSSQIPSILLSERVKKKVTVALTGDGGDELFGGYNRYLYSKQVLKFMKVIPYRLRSKFFKLLSNINSEKISNFLLKYNDSIKSKVSNFGDKFSKISEKFTYIENENDLFLSLISQWPRNSKIFINPIIEDSVKDHFLKENKNELIINRMMLSDINYYLPDDILCKIDRAAMQFGLETRVPFISREIFEFSQKLPINQKIKNNKGKIILRNILSKFVPDELIDRPKMGFSIPLENYLRTSLKSWGQDLINTKSLYEEYFNFDEVFKIWDMHQTKKNNFHTKLWPILSFISWRKYNS